MLSDKLPPLSNITRGSLTCSRPLESKKASYYLFFLQLEHMISPSLPKMLILLEWQSGCDVNGL